MKKIYGNPILYYCHWQLTLHHVRGSGGRRGEMLHTRNSLTIWSVKQKYRRRRLNKTLMIEFPRRHSTLCCHVNACESRTPCSQCGSTFWRHSWAVYRVSYLICRSRNNWRVLLVCRSFCSLGRHRGRSRSRATARPVGKRMISISYSSYWTKLVHVEWRSLFNRSID